MRAARPLTLALVAAAVAAPAAAASPLSLQVVNGRGVEQASFVQLTSAGCPAGCTLLTDGHGRLTLDAVGGDRLAVTRGGLAPEGTGVTYLVPASPPTGPVRITLPALLNPVAPQQDASEAWLLARVNQERAALGRAPLQRSATLDRAADAYAHYLLSTNQFSHTALADPDVRAVDQGWPVIGGVGETLALAPSKESALELWRNSSPHWSLLMMDGRTAAGVGRAGDRWVMSPGSCSPTDAPERCELGVGAVAPSPKTGPTPTGGTQPARRARLRLRIRHQGLRLRISVRVVEGRGAVRIAVRQGHRRARLHARRRGAVQRAWTTLPHGGRWKVAVVFRGAGGWNSRRLAPRVIRVSRE